MRRFDLDGAGAGVPDAVVERGGEDRIRFCFFFFFFLRGRGSGSCGSCGSSADDPLDSADKGLGVERPVRAPARKHLFGSWVDRIRKLRLGEVEAVHREHDRDVAFV